MIEPPKPPLLPPRPNLGPEPFADPRLFGPLVLVGILAGLAIVAILVVYTRRRRRLVASRDQADGRSTSGEPPSPRDRLIALSPSIRSALTRRFGPSCLAKTTEELAGDGRIGEVLGVADFESLIGILNAIDRLKFSTPVLADDDGLALAGQLAAWEPSVAQLTKALENGRK